MSANWITGENCNIFKKDFNCQGDFLSAKLSVTAKGVYEAFLNGTRVGEFILAPGFTSYHKRHLYQEYDVTEMLKHNDDNELTIWVGDGWYKGRLMWKDHARPNIFGDKLVVWAKLEIVYSDRTETIVSDESWNCSRSPVVFDSIYDGEIYDARIEPMFEERAKILNAPTDNILPQDGEIVKEQERLSPIAEFTTLKGEHVLDFGQNLVGYVEVKLTAKSGDVVKISHAEILDFDGNFYTDNLRNVNARTEYICKDGFQVYKPRFTFMGFRYIRIDSCPDDAEFTAIAVHSDIKRTGYFESSNKLLNRFFQNVIWGQKSNFLDIPTDCNQRDERMGWTGDAQAFVKVASYNFDVNKFFEKWLNDLSADQLENGNIPHIIPNCFPDEFKSKCAGSPAWGDAATVCPWQIYMTYGNKELLARQFESMKKWVDFCKTTPERPSFGDWLGLDAPGNDLKGASSEEFIKLAYNAYSTELLVKAGKILEHDVSKYETLYANLVDDFQTKFVCKTQTEHALTLCFNLAADRQKTADSLAEIVKNVDYKLQTGFVGTPFILHALSDNGYADIAYTLLLREEYPSWLYPVTKGATTIWERWNGITPDGKFADVNMNSFNHYAYGAVADWLYEAAAGIKPAKPGFEHIIIQPLTDKRLNFISASIETKHGKISSKWEWEDDKIVYTIEVPTTATIIIDNTEHNVDKGNYKFGSE